MMSPSLPRAAASACVLLLASAAEEPAPRLLWNTTSSAPEGLFLVQPKREAKVGDWVAARPPDAFRRWLAEGGYLPAGVPLVKRVTAGPGQLVCRRGVALFVDGQDVAHARPRDRRGRPLPAWRGCRRLDGGEVLLLTDHPDGLDGRYFGPVSATLLLGVLRPIATWTAS